MEATLAMIVVGRWTANRIDEGSRDVHQSAQGKPRPSHLKFSLLQAI